MKKLARPHARFDRSTGTGGSWTLALIAVALLAATGFGPAHAQNSATGNSSAQPPAITKQIAAANPVNATGNLAEPPATASGQSAGNNDLQAASDGNTREGGDPWGWLKVIVGGLVGGAGVLATQWITARTNRKIASVQAEISRSAVQVAADAAKASALGASAAVESAGAARESAAVAGRNADNLGIHAVAGLRQEWINTVRDELSRLHALLSNYRPIPPKATPGQTIAYEQRQRDANQCKAKIALLLNPREVASRNLAIVIRKLDDPALPIADRARWSRWIVRWGQILLKEEWDRVRAELKGETTVPPFRRVRR